MVQHLKHHHIDSAFIYGFAVLSVLILSNIAKPLLKGHLGIIPKVIKKTITTQAYFNKDVFTTVSIKGKGYVVYDVIGREIIASKNGTTTLPLASITKIMMAVTAYNHLDRHRKIVISEKSIDGSYDLGLKNGQTWSLDELLKYTLVFSSNDGAQVIADSKGRDTFVGLMNSDARELGLNLQFTQPAGLDDGNKLGGVGTAYDVAKLFAVAHRMFPAVLDATTKRRVNVTSSQGRITGIPNTNQEIHTIIGAEGSKTGYTDLAGGNLAVITEISLGRPVVIVVLGSTKEERFSDVALLYKALLKSIEK